MQELYLRDHQVLPDCDQIEKWLREGATIIHDNIGDYDNVENTGDRFPRLDALGSLKMLNDNGELIG